MRRRQLSLLEPAKGLQSPPDQPTLPGASDLLPWAELGKVLNEPEGLGLCLELPLTTTILIKKNLPEH